MMCAMVKKGLLGAALGTGALFLVFGTSAPSYVKTAFHKVRNNVQGAVPPQFEIDRARQAIEDLKPMFDQNKETLARAEIEVEHLEKEVTTIQANLDREQKTIVSLRDSIKTGEIRLTGHVKDTEHRPRPSWPTVWTISGTRPICSSRRTTSSRPSGRPSSPLANSSRRCAGRS